MLKYLFSFDARDTKPGVYDKIHEILDDRFDNLNHPVASTYVFEDGEQQIDELVKELKTKFERYNMTFVIARIMDYAYAEGETGIRRYNERVAELMKGIVLTGERFNIEAFDPLYKALFSPD